MEDQVHAAFAAHIADVPSLEVVLLWAVARNIVALAFDPVTQTIEARARATFAHPWIMIDTGVGTPRANG